MTKLFIKHSFKLKVDRKKFFKNYYSYLDAIILPHFYESTSAETLPVYDITH